MSSNCCSSTSKLPIVGSDLLCIVNSEWSSKCVKLLVLHDNQAWSGKVVEDEDTTDLLDQLSMTQDKYMEETKKALTTNGGAKHFAYTLESDKFTWKKYVTENMAVKFGFITLEKVPAFSVFEEIIDKNLQENLELNNQMKKTAQQNDNITKGLSKISELKIVDYKIKLQINECVLENEDLKARLNDLIGKKIEMESSLYSQFVYLLNEKKRRINELQNQFLPSGEGENEQSLNQSDSDPFGSDTELDSEDEEKQSPSRVGSKDSVLAKEENICNLPKRSKPPSKVESMAGPSGLCQKSKDKISISKSSSNKSPKNEKLAIRPQGKGKKSLKFSCVMGNLSNNKEQSSPEDDVFMFPKRSKRVGNDIDLMKPSTSKIKYDSDDEMPLGKTQKIDADSDSTLSRLDDIDIIKTSITVKNPQEINSKITNSISGEKNHVSESKKNSDSNSIKSKNKSESVQEASFKDFSNSTLDILNQLV